ncbi:MAG: type II secretion system protein GspC [Alphaproteobacteria bacterium]
MHWAASRLALLALAAISAATLVSSVVRSRLSLAGRPARTVAAPESRSAPARPVSDYLALSKRNVFAAPSTAEPSSPAAWLPAAPGSFRLVGTGRRGGQRFAIVEDTAAKKQLVVGPGESLGGARIARIGWRNLVLDRGGAREVLSVTDVPVAGADASHPVALATPGASPAGVADDSVKKIGDDRWMVAQAEVDESLSNLSDLITQLRAVPNQENGKTTGFKLFAIKRGSLFQKIGLENNDVVQRVNGIDLNDPTRAMALLQELQGQTKLSVDVVRGGEARTLTYEIR